MPGDALSKLEVAIRKSSETPPKISLSVTNTHDKPLTILTWNTPLDPLALKLGLLSFTPDGASEPLEIPSIQIRRKMPPGSDSLVTIQPGETKEQELKLAEPIIPLSKLEGKVSITCEGRWMGAWQSEAKDISEGDLDQLGTGPLALTGSFTAKPVVIVL